MNLTHMTCTIDGCTKNTVARGWCPTHWARWRRHGDPNITLQIRGDVGAKLDRYTDRAHPAGCWVWTGDLDRDGYGRVRGGNSRLAHRVSYEHHVGPIPEGKQLDHLCRNRACVNPKHLEPVNNRTNQVRGKTFPAANVRKTHCPRNHPYAGENLHINRRGARVCRTCERDRVRARRAAA